MLSIFPITLHTTLLIIVLILAIIVSLNYYSAKRKKWFHLFIRLVKDGKCLLCIFTLSIYILVAYNKDCLKIPVDYPNGLDSILNEIMYVIAGGFISGYIIYIITILIPKAIRQKPILLRVKTILWNAICEIETLMCGKDTGNKYSVMTILKDYSHWNGTMASFTMNNKNGKYMLSVLNYLSVTINSIVTYAEYIDAIDLDIMCQMSNSIEKEQERLKDSIDHSVYNDAKAVEELSDCISSVYNNLTDIHSKLKSIV